MDEDLEESEELEDASSGVSRSGGNNSSNSFLQANINSLVVGNARLVWQSINPNPELSGRHAVLSRMKKI
jgi:hypothetical protein